jgi:uncharacterized protein
MLFKILLLAAVIGGIYYFFIKKRPQISKDSEIMVECNKCGTFVSNKEAIIKDGKYYCSKECANAS